MHKVCAEIEYITKSGKRIHSDICPTDCSSANLNDKEYRQIIHEILDEWLNNSNGSGGFYIKNSSFKFNY